MLKAFHIATGQKRSQKRALLVGINDYPNPAQRLEGCVNDTFLVSSTLQECRFTPEDIRVVLNERATAAGIRERLDWLLSDARDGDVRVFYYSGHGAHIPNRGGSESGEGDDECLVPHDFDWTPESAIVDDWFYELYSQLPYESDFLAIFDCCHSGGITKDGSVRARGITPPDDIRHRAIRWDSESEMWVPNTDISALNELVEEWKPISDRQHKLESAPEAIIGPEKQQPSAVAVDYFGQSGRLKRLGRAVEVRVAANRGAASSKAKFEKAKKNYGHHGPYLPVLLEACQEDQLAYEYRHGVTSYGAFTFALTSAFRDARRKARASARPVLPSWNELIRTVRERIAKLQNDQDPVLVCRKSYRDTPIPWSLVSEKKKAGRP
jgi:hypothetical protein